jgi:site-specific DNA recombinase
VVALLEDPQRLEQEYQRRLETPSRENENLTVTQAQLAKVRQGIARLIDSYTEGFIQKQEFEPRIKRLRDRLASLEDRDRQIKTQLAQQAELRLVITQLTDFSAKLKDSLAEADWLTKRDLIRALVKRVEIGPEVVNIIFRVIPDPFESSPDRGSLQHCWGRDDAPLRCSGWRRREVYPHHNSCFQPFPDDESGW